MEEGELEVWLVVSGEALEREGVDNTEGVTGVLSGGCTPLTW